MGNGLATTRVPRARRSAVRGKGGLHQFDTGERPARSVGLRGAIAIKDGPWAGK